jgi:hypothetical protein
VGSATATWGEIRNRTNPASQIPKSEIADWTASSGHLFNWFTPCESNLRFRISGSEMQDSSDFSFLTLKGRVLKSKVQELSSGLR